MPADEAAIADDVRTLHGLGYAQELLRRMSGFSNYAISLSIICILAGGVTSFQQGLCSVGGASIGLGWPLGSLISLCFALTMAQVASAFPTAGGLYHWASILGGRGWGWITAWFNLAGLITVLAAINVGAYQFTVGTFGPRLGLDGIGFDATQPGPAVELAIQIAAVLLITFSQALLNHRGIRVTTLLTDFSGYWILVVAVALTAAMLWFADHLDPSRLVTFDNFSGRPPGDAAIWPRTDEVGWLFLLGLLLPAYTITGFDASAHTSEETISASRNAPRGIVRSVAVSAIFGWLMLAAVVSAAPDLGTAAAQGANSFQAIVDAVVPQWCALALYAGIAIAQYLCGLATLTSASRMCYAFARDGGLPFSHQLRRVSPTYRTPAIAIWTTATLTVLFTVYTPVYSTIAAACVIFLYVSYVIPTALGLFAYNRTWTKMGPWTIGGWYRPLAVLCILGCGLLLVIGVQPPNDKNLWIVGGALAATVLVWFGFERHHFSGPPQGVMIEQRQAEIRAAEAAVARTLGPNSSNSSNAAGPVHLVGLDFGSTTASAIVATAQLVRNCVTGRRELNQVEEQFRSEPVFTPFQEGSIDIKRAEAYIDQWLVAGNVGPHGIFGGGALITGLAARQSNAAALAASIRRRLGDTLIATADDPCLESWLAFMGSCRELSRGVPDAPFLNLDIGGGTANLAWGQAGEVSRVGCYYVGARHVEVIPGTYQLVRLSTFALRLFEELKIQARAGDVLSADDVAAILDFYVATLEAAILDNDAFLSREAVRLHQQVAFHPPQGATPVITLSGGVGELAYRHARGEPLPATTAFGDLGIDFAERICHSPLLAKDLKQFVPPNLGRATVYGLTIHNTEVSGSTLFLPRPEILPLGDLPIVGRLAIDATPEQILSLLELARVATRGAGLHVDCPPADWQAIKALGQRLAEALDACQFPSDRPLVLFVAGDVGKTLGQYASGWGKSSVNLVVIDEIPDRRAHFASVGRMCENAVPVSFYGLYHGDDRR